MQPIPGQGPHNPGGRTEEQVLAALQGLSGAARWSFRYELLDKDNRKLRDMDDSEVEANSGRVSLNNLADIKRVAQLRVRANTSIDWLSDRIKPWARLHLPPYGDQDWVEWPLGVFLPTTPTRQIDTTSTVWRDIDLDDQCIVLADDQVPARYSTAGLLDVSDHFSRDLSGAWGFPDTGPQWAQSVVAGTVYGVTTADGGYAFATLEANRSLLRLNVPDGRYRDGEVRTRFSVSQTATGEAFLPSVILRLTETADYYRVRVRFNTDSTLTLDVTNGVTQVGASVVTELTYTPGGWINVRARISGQDVMGKVWADGAPEPLGWQIERTITTAVLAEGRFGVGASAFGGNTNTNPQLRYGLYEMDGNPDNLVTGHVRRVLTGAGVHAHNITPSEQTLTSIREWDPGTSRLRIANDLLTSINYRTVSFDEHGTAVAEPYVPPSERSPEYTYADDHRGIMFPDVEQERDLHAIPNRWVLASGDADSDPVSVAFTNRDPASPTSVPRRGRVITDFRDQEEAASESALIEQAARIAEESSQLYEAVEMTTALNPLHSHDDLVWVRRDDAAIDAGFTSHTWDLDLDATGTMSHRVRRVVNLGAPGDPGIVVGDATVTGAIEAGNIATGTTAVSPVANVPTAVTVTGLNLQGTGGVRVQVTAITAFPGSALREVTIRDPSPDGFTIWMLRTTTAAMNVQWIAIRGA